MDKTIRGSLLEGNIILKPPTFIASATIPKPSPTKVTDLEASLATLSTAASDVLKLIQIESRKEIPHADRAEYVRLEIAVADLLFALRAAA